MLECVLEQVILFLLLSGNERDRTVVIGWVVCRQIATAQLMMVMMINERETAVVVSKRLVPPHSLIHFSNQMPVSDADQWTIEKTPSYFIRRQVPARVFAFNPNMKLLLIVRNPVQRAISGNFTTFHYIL